MSKENVTGPPAGNTPKRHAPRGPIKAKDSPMDAPGPHGYTPCTATSKQSGVRCKRRPIVGGYVCTMHGGKAPHVKQAAQERLQGYQDIAIDRLLALVKQTTYPSTAYQAVRDVLDRTLGKPAESVAVSHSGAIRMLHELPDE